MKRVIKNAQDVQIGDWYEGKEVVSTRDWGFAIDIWLDDRTCRTLVWGRKVVVVVPDKNDASR